MPASWIRPAWPAPPHVRAMVTTREGGVSRGPYESLNLALHVGDEPGDVAQNRARLARSTGCDEQAFCWLQQVHGTRVVEAGSAITAPKADGAFSSERGRVCVVMTADCLPVLLCDREGRRVAAVHAGWRGLVSGVLESALRCFAQANQVMAWLGPAIGPDKFEVGPEVREQFCAGHSEACKAFQARPHNKFVADIYLLARQRLKAAGVDAIYGEDFCTFGDAQRFFSYRRQGDASGRMASLIWLA